MKHILSLIVLMAFCFSSCNDWLDVRPETEQKEEDQFSSVNGFFDALVGCYMSMAEDDAYGERLSYSNIESLANMWYIPSSTDRDEDQDLSVHDYTTDDSRNAISAMYSSLFYVIAQANVIIKNAEERGNEVFVDESMLNVVKGEAYAIRAFCQFDILRLFGQMPKNASQQVELPYNLGTGIDNLPAYYGFDKYVELLKNDLLQAEDYLAENDPVYDTPFESLSGLANDYLYYRQSRLNYWAVKALQARVYLYVGETTDAYNAAKAIITGNDGEPVRAMSGATDLPTYKLCPNEFLFGLSKYNISTVSTPILIGGSGSQYRLDGSEYLALSPSMYTDLYADLPTDYSAYNRRTSVWASAEEPVSHEIYRTLNKYYYDNTDGNIETADLMNYYQWVPMLRMSEVYLIAMESTTDLTEMNEWFVDYMEAHNVSSTMIIPFASLEEGREFLFNEYRREFFGEGQMFYTYKRNGSTRFMWNDNTNIGESVYILPLPNTEYNPNDL